MIKIERTLEAMIMNLLRRMGMAAYNLFMYKYNKQWDKRSKIKSDKDSVCYFLFAVISSFPAVDLPTKNYSLDADMINGWRPKEMKLMGPIPLNF